METMIETTKTSSPGLENIPIIDIDIEDETEIEFSYSTPEKVEDFLNKWKPKIHDVVSIVEEEVIEYSDDEEDLCQKRISTDSNAVYIDEDTIKQEEEFEDENIEVLNENEEVELNISFDEAKIKTEHNMNDNLSIKLDRINPLKIQNSFSIVNGNLSNNLSRTTRSTKTVSRTTNNSSRRNPRSNNNVDRLDRKRPIKLNPKQKNLISEKHSIIKKSRPLNRKSNEKNDAKSKTIDERRSLRLSGRVPEFEHGVISDLSVNNPLFTSRSGKKRTLPPDLTANRKEKPIEVPPKRIRSLSPSAYRKNITEMYVCVCCDHKYSSLEQIREHIKSHFSNVRFD